MLAAADSLSHQETTWVIIIGTLIVIFAPAFLAESGRKGARFLAWVLSFAGIALAVASVTGGILGLAAILPLAGLLWLGGMVCALAAFIDRALNDIRPRVSESPPPERQPPPVTRKEPVFK